MKNELTREDIEQFLQMLTGGELPDGMRMKAQPQLTAAQAASVLWYIQEQLHAIPDHWECCAICSGLFDAYAEGGTHHELGACCDECLSDTVFCTSCCEHFKYGTFNEDEGEVCPECQEGR